MLVKYAQPVKGKRELMCKTDEARVSRIWTDSSPYNGMVERLQTVKEYHPRRSQYFYIQNQEHTGTGFDSSDTFYHLYKFLTLVIAKSVFPENFCDARELRFFRRRGKIHSATYSKFVDDETNVIERRRQAMQGFYRALGESDDAAARFRDVTDRLERELNPDLADIEAKALAAGITTAHPECNYHVSHGSTVFFETRAIDIAKLAMTAPTRNAKHVITLLSLMQAMEIIRDSRMALPESDPTLKPFRKEIVDAGLFGIYPIIFSLMANRRSERGVFDSNEFGKWGLDFWRLLADLNPVPVPCPFRIISPKAYGFLLEEDQRLNP